MKGQLTAISFNGLNTDCLGNYLAAVGLLIALSQRWTKLRGCWRNGGFVILTDDPSVDLASIKKFLLKEWEATNYDRWWGNTQKADTKAKSSAGISRERNQRSVAEVRLLDAHLVATGRNKFNPVLGTGGNVGKRDLAKAFRDSLKLLTKPESESWLDAALLGSLDVNLPDLSNGGTWFVFANKTFNSGQAWYREGKLSPWAQILATEGAFLLVGGVNRRLGSRARPYAVFPFISEPANPESDGEIGMSRAEFWAPLWTFPATLTEVRALFQRGLATLGGRPAQAPHEFAVAVLSAGVDSGIGEFARFELRQTTSSQVYEAIPRQRIHVPPAGNSPSEMHCRVVSTLLVRLIESGWLDRLPFEPRKSNQKGKFVGLRGPIEAAMVQLAEEPDEGERWRQLLKRLASAQSRIDLNKNLRERCVAIPPLAPDWFHHAWSETAPPEISIAQAIASVGWHLGHDSIPLQSNLFGTALRQRGKKWFALLPETRPVQAVWAPGDPLQMILDVAERRLTDAEGLPRAPFAGTRHCSGTLIARFLCSTDLDLGEVANWIPPLSLIDWSQQPRAAIRYSMVDNLSHASDGTVMLHALVRPLFHADQQSDVFFDKEKRLFRRDQLPKANLLRRLFHLLRFGEIDEAIQVLRDRYLAVGRTIVMPPQGLVADGERIAAALLIPMSDHDVKHGLERWLQPSRNCLTSAGRIK